MSTTLQFGKIKKKVKKRTAEEARRCFPVLLQHTDPCFIHVCEKTGKITLQYGAHVGPDPSEKASFGKYLTAIGYEHPQPFPDQILEMIFGNLDINELFAAETVCKKWRELIKEEWKRRCEIHFEPLLEQQRIIFQEWGPIHDLDYLLYAWTFHNYHHHNEKPYSSLFYGCLPFKKNTFTRPWSSLDPKNKNPFGVSWFFSEYHLTETFYSPNFSLSFNDVDLGDSYRLEILKVNEKFILRFCALNDAKRPLLDMHLGAKIGYDLDIKDKKIGYFQKYHFSDIPKRESSWNISNLLSLDQLLRMKHYKYKWIRVDIYLSDLLLK